MSFDMFNQYVVALGAAIGAVTGLVNLYLLTRRRKDRFLVRCGSVMPDDGQETMLHVISKSDHAITISDFGYITVDGKLHSIPMDEDVNWHNEVIVKRGDLTLRHYNDITERGIRFPATLGVFAKLAGVDRPQLAFHRETALYHRIKVRSRLFVSPNYFLW